MLVFSNLPHVVDRAEAELGESIGNCWRMSVSRCCLPQTKARDDVTMLHCVPVRGRPSTRTFIAGCFFDVSTV
jgi:hypothetical protein